ncbi:MAG: glycosyltransferase [Gemmatimonadaceae bacterium]
MAGGRRRTEPEVRDRGVRVVYLNPSGQIGGAERSLLDVMASLRKAEPAWELRLVTAGDGPLMAEAAAVGVETTALPFPAALARLGDAAAGGPAGDGVRRGAVLRRLLTAAPAVGAYAWRLRSTLTAQKPDVVHTNGFKMHVLGALAAARHVPVVWHIHDHVSERPLMSRFLKLSAGRCAGVVANSDSAARQASAVCGERVPVVTIYNAVDLERFAPSGTVLDLDALAGSPPAPDGTVRVGLVATFGRWKGHETFLRAIAKLPGGLPIRAYIVGGPIYETQGSQYTHDELRRLAGELEIAHHVAFTGHVRQSDAAMRALDVVVHASTHPEPFGLVIAEAMACGRAVIASRAGGAAEIIDAEENALGHPPGDAAGLARCIERLVTDPALRERLGTAGRATAERRFDRARLGGEFGAVYRDAIARAA